MLNSQRGTGLLLVILVFAVLFALVGVSLERSGSLAATLQKHASETAALNLADAGLAYATDKLVHSAGKFYGEENVQLDSTGTFSVSVAHLTPSDKIEIISTGRAKGAGAFPEVVKTIRVIVQFSAERTERPLVLISRTDVL